MVEGSEIEQEIDRMLQISTDASIVFTIEHILREEFEEMLGQLDSEKGELGQDKYLELRRRLLQRSSELGAGLNRFAQSSSFSKTQKFREEQLKVWQTDNFEKRLAGFFIKSARPGNKQHINAILRDEFQPLLLELTLRQDELGEKKYQRYQRDLWKRKEFLSAGLLLVEEDGKIPRDAQVKNYVEGRLLFVPDPATDEHFQRQKEDLKTALTEVVSRIWDQAKEKLFLIEHIFLAQDPFVHWTHQRSSVQGSSPHCVMCIYLPGCLLYERPARLRHIIAHELAHAISGHGLPSSKLDEDKREAEASKMAIKWGFPPQKKEKGKKPKGGD